MNINFFSKKKIKNEPTTEELIERGFAPKNEKIDIDRRARLLERQHKLLQQKLREDD